MKMIKDVQWVYDMDDKSEKQICGVYKLLEDEKLIGEFYQMPKNKNIFLLGDEKFISIKIKRKFPLSKQDAIMELKTNEVIVIFKHSSFGFDNECNEKVIFRNEIYRFKSEININREIFDFSISNKEKSIKIIYSFKLKVAQFFADRKNWHHQSFIGNIETNTNNYLLIIVGFYLIELAIRGIVYEIKE
jgi:hypothetical protein